MKESKLWILHLFAGVIILVLLAIHMGIMHLDDIMNAIGWTSGDPIESEQVFARSQSLFFMVTYILLLGAALYHGFFGLRTIISEAIASPVRTVLIWGFSLLGLALFVYGTYAAIVVFMAKEVL